MVCVNGRIKNTQVRKGPQLVKRRHSPIILSAQPSSVHRCDIALCVALVCIGHTGASGASVCIAAEARTPPVAGNIRAVPAEGVYRGTQVTRGIPFNLPHQARYVVSHAVPERPCRFVARCAPDTVLYRQRRSITPYAGKIESSHTSAHFLEGSRLRTGISPDETILLLHPQIAHPVDGRANGMENPTPGRTEVLLAPIDAGVIELASSTQRGCRCTRCQCEQLCRLQTRGSHVVQNFVMARPLVRRVCLEVVAKRIGTDGARANGRSAQSTCLQQCAKPIPSGIDGPRVDGCRERLNAAGIECIESCGEVLHAQCGGEYRSRERCEVGRATGVGIPIQGTRLEEAGWGCANHLHAIRPCRTTHCRHRNDATRPIRALHLDRSSTYGCADSHRAPQGEGACSRGSWRATSATGTCEPRNNQQRNTPHPSKRQRGGSCKLFSLGTGRSPRMAPLKKLRGGSRQGHVCNLPVGQSIVFTLEPSALRQVEDNGDFMSREKANRP